MFLTCEQLAQNLSELEDGRVNAVRRAEAAFHLSWCRDCQAYVAQFRAVRATLAAQKAVDDAAPAVAALTVFRDWHPGGGGNDDDDGDDGDLP